MSEVHFGYDERLDRPVAVKLLRPPAYVPGSPDSPEAVEILDALDRDQKRFLREIRMTARLELAGMPAVYDTGVETAGRGTQLWLVMQLLRGSTLETLLDHTLSTSRLRRAWRGRRRSPRRSRRCLPTCTGWTSCTATSSPATSWSPTAAW